MKLQSENLSIKLLTDVDLSDANRVIVASKSYWKYSNEYLEEANKLLHLHQKCLQVQKFFALWEKDELIGLFSFCRNEDETLLDHFWLTPKIIGKGYGQYLWKAAVDIAINEKISGFKIFSDPPAEGFYIKMGAVKIGEKASRIMGGPIFPVLEYKI